MKCLTCRHCVIDGGSPAYSDVTPGDSPSWVCKRGQWTHMSYPDKHEIADAFRIGETCDQWEDDGRKGRSP